MWVNQCENHYLYRFNAKVSTFIHCFCITVFLSGLISLEFSSGFSYRLVGLIKVDDRMRVGHVWILQLWCWYIEGYPE